METKTHFKGLLFGGDVLRRGDIVRLQPEKEKEERYETFMKVTSVYQDVELFDRRTGRIVSDVQAASLPLEEIGEKRTMRITGEELVLMPCNRPGLPDQLVWHLSTRPGESSEVTQGDVSGRWRPGFDDGVGKMDVEVVADDYQGEGWGVGGDVEEQRLEAERACWNDRDVLEALGIGGGSGTRRTTRRDERNVEAQEDAGASSASALGPAAQFFNSAQVELLDDEDHLWD